MAYVSLGRTELLKDIYIKGKVDPKGIHASPKALEETWRLQSQKQKTEHYATCKSLEDKGGFFDK